MDIGYRERAEILNLKGEFQFALKCKRVSKHATTSGFVGMGQLSGLWSVQLATRDEIDAKKYREGETRVRYNGNVYILVSTERYDSRPLRGRMARTETVLYLQ